jgi:hypothetical protein
MGKQKPKTDLSTEAVRRFLLYDPHTGMWLWRADGVNRKKGWFAGIKHNKGYWALRIGRGRYLAHRIAWLWMTGEWPKHEIDHIDLDRSNNKWGNLREATFAQQARNTKQRTHNTSGFRGVSFNRRIAKWAAGIRVEGRRVHLGYFPTAEEAGAAYREASERLHGAHGRLQ